MGVQLILQALKYNFLDVSTKPKILKMTLASFFGTRLLFRSGKIINTVLNIVINPWINHVFNFIYNLRKLVLFIT